MSNTFSRHSSHHFRDSKQELLYFTDAESYEERARIVRYAFENQSIYGKLTAADLAIELAYATEHEPTRKSLVDRAHTAYTYVANKKSANSISTRAKGKFKLAAFAVDSSALLDGTLPDMAARETMYGELIGVGDFIRHSHQHRLESGIRDSEGMDLIGVLGEVVATTLLQRFGNRDKQPYTARPSLASQDVGSRHLYFETGIRNSWDVTVLTQYDAASKPEDTYRIQVKTAPAPNEESIYTDDIVLVTISRDLKLPSELKGVLPRTISAELSYEHEGDKSGSVTGRLDQRTNLLLDIMG